MGYAEILQAVIAADAPRWSVLALVRDLNLPHSWIGAGFVRSAVWDHLHGRDSPITGDIDVIWFDPDEDSPSIDRQLEAILKAQQPQLRWSVKNQARMHLRNSDAKYESISDALRHWPETATAVAVRLTATDEFEIVAPYGLYDLFELRLTPTPPFRGSKLPIFKKEGRGERVA